MAKTPLSREKILAAALAIVDREGLAALSMRRVAEAVGVEAMSLYHHVANKAALLDGVFELVLAELPPWRRGPTWRASLRTRSLDLRATLRAHPNALPLFATRPAVTPAAIAHLEMGLAALREAGLSVRDALSTFQVLLAYVVGHAIASFAAGGDDRAEPDYAALPAYAFPRVRETMAATDRRDIDAEFELGLDALLDGLERRQRAKR
jgi:AcrR family transcriptional regulator